VTNKRKKEEEKKTNERNERVFFGRKKGISTKPEKKGERKSKTQYVCC
jgi:hypothetical protein